MEKKTDFKKYALELEGRTSELLLDKYTTSPKHSSSSVGSISILLTGKVNAVLLVNRPMCRLALFAAVIN